jgi:hypothetical protein
MDDARERAYRAAKLEADLAAAARKDLCRAAEFCLRSERTGKPLVLTDEHRKMVEFVEANKRCVIVAAPKLGKTTLITYMRLLYRLGMNPTRYRAKVWSASKTNATRHTIKLRAMVESNRRLALIFPNLRPGAEKWTEEEWTVDRGSGLHVKEPSVWACGEDAQNQGFRSDDDYFDDMMDPVISASRYRCEKQAEFVMDNESRVEADGWRIYVQNCFRRWDTGWILAEKFGWPLLLMPAIDALDRTLYPAIWPQSDCDAYNPARKDQDLRCVPKREGDSIFAEAYLHRAMTLGEGRNPETSIDPRTLPEGVFTVTALDPAGGKDKKKSDLWALVDLLVGPPSYWGMPGFGVDAKGRPIRVVQILNVESGKWTAPEARQKLIEHHERYGSYIVVEDAGVQDWMRQLLAVDAPQVPVRALATTAKLKHHVELGFESWAARWSQGLVIVPSFRDEAGVLKTLPEIGRLLDDLRGYDPDSHTGDRAMAAWIGDVSARTTDLFSHAVGVAGDDFDDGELRATGLDDEEIAAMRRASGSASKQPAEAGDADAVAMRRFLRKQLTEAHVRDDAIDDGVSWRFG